MNKRAIAQIYIIVLAIVLIVSLGYLAFNGTLSVADLSSQNTFVKPSWAGLYCEQDVSNPADIFYSLSAVKTFPCNANTEKCQVRVTNTFAVPLIRYIEYSLCSSTGCGSWQRVNMINTNTAVLPELNNGQNYQIRTGSGQDSATRIELQYIPYKLFRHVGGAKFPVNSYDCHLASGDLAKIPAKDIKGTELFRTGGIGQSWVNYVDDWFYGPGTNIVTYNGQKAYCSAGKVFNIVKLQMKDGTLVQLDPTYKGTEADGSSLSGLGSVISNVECCPNEPTCGSDFKYHSADSSQSTQNTAQCFTDLQCHGTGDPIPVDAYNYVTYKCVSGKCVKSSPIRVECTTNAQCNNGQICDLSLLNYGKCITQKQGSFCGDGICQNTENHNICPADCDFTCLQGQKLVTTSTATFWSVIGIAQATKTTQCEQKTFWNEYGLWIVLGVALLLIFFFLFFRKDLRIVAGVIMVLLVYLAYTYLGAGLSIFIIILGLIALFLWIFRRQVLGIVRFAI